MLSKISTWFHRKRKLVPLQWGYYLQTHGTTMETKTTVSFANIYMAKIETKLIQ